MLVAVQRTGIRLSVTDIIQFLKRKKKIENERGIKNRRIRNETM